MKSLRSIFFILITSSVLFGQSSLLDSTRLDKIGSKKNAFFIEGAGSSYIAGVFYQRTVPLANNLVHLRFQGGFSPFVFGMVSFSSGISFTTGAGVYFLRSRFKIGATMMLLHGIYFEPYTVVDPGPGPDMKTGYQLFLQPQLNFEYHFSQRFVGRIAFTPTFIPGLNNGRNIYTFYPWGGIAFGYKF